MIRRSDDGSELHGDRIWDIWNRLARLEVKVEGILWWMKALALAVIGLAGALLAQRIGQ